MSQRDRPPSVVMGAGKWGYIPSRLSPVSLASAAPKCSAWLIRFSMFLSSIVIVLYLSITFRTLPGAAPLSVHSFLWHNYDVEVSDTMWAQGNP